MSTSSSASRGTSGRAAHRGVNGIFCLECTWSNTLRDASSVRPVLELLSARWGAAVPFIHRHVDVREAFDAYLKQWTKGKYTAYPILYLVFHGSGGEIIVGDRRRRDARVTLLELAEILGDECAGRVIHIGSCDSLTDHGNRVQKFLRDTRALALCGYRADADWLECSAFEALLFGRLQGAELSRKSLPGMMRKVKSEYGCLAGQIGFHHVMRKGA